MNGRHIDQKYGIFLITGDNGTGKTRFLTKLSQRIKKDLSKQICLYDKLICLSGTVYEKYPKPDKNPAYFSSNSYYYFGYKANNNMFSEITPFRAILNSMFSNAGLVEERSGYVAKLLKEIGFSSEIKLDFRWARNSRENESFTPLILDFDKDTTRLYEHSVKELIFQEKAHLKTIFFIKNGNDIPISGLSSGERLFLITILSLCFTVTNNSLTIFDEPENSMHPKWQEKITRVLCNIFQRYAPNSALYIATHSPLVLSSVPNELAHIFNRRTKAPSAENAKYNGNNVDTVLKQHFGLKSARSLEFIEAMQSCLTAMTHQHIDFKKKFETLKEMQISLDENDPLYDAYNTITAFAEETL
ncbi:ABC transporter [Pseudoalteromonas sp. SW0106-04]|uniref:AAA family ATPase n=1 Tax=Pseudoalteromonas sp. SW0106-04 TaxID=1702169 RepID=UPI0006B5C9AE|nr:AAA family ATPase [Pseudoalteromonas sp. SW0106-04]GAP75822.1 ABC transporter [Pseudoalteromonas sp. SW0106-04]